MARKLSVRGDNLGYAQVVSHAMLLLQLNSFYQERRGGFWPIDPSDNLTGLQREGVSSSPQGKDKGRSCLHLFLAKEDFVLKRTDM